MGMDSGTGGMGSMGMGDVTPDDKLWAALAYPLSPVVPIIILLLEDKKKRPFIQAHNAQALAVGIVNTVILLVGTITVVGLVCLGPVSLLIFLYQLYLAYQAYQGKHITIPVITSFVKNQGWA